MKSFLQYLEEAYVSPNNGAKYGQVIFLVGGAASGKSTAIRKFIDSASYKTINPDDVKDLMRKASKRGIKGFEDLAGVDHTHSKGSSIVPPEDARHKTLIKILKTNYIRSKSLGGCIS